mgnify:CR=1 FL=1|jgi:hypothetical protein
MKERRRQLKELEQKIVGKIDKMVRYDKFLMDVIEQYSDEFEGPENVVARYKTLKESNERLKKSIRLQEQMSESLAEQTVSFEK